MKVQFTGAGALRHRNAHNDMIPTIGCPGKLISLLSIIIVKKSFLAHEKFNKQIIMPDLLNEVREAPNAEKLIWRFYIIMVSL